MIIFSWRFYYLKYVAKCHCFIPTLRSLLFLHLDKKERSQYLTVYPCVNLHIETPNFPTSKGNQNIFEKSSSLRTQRENYCERLTRGKQLLVRIFAWYEDRGFEKWRVFNREFARLKSIIFTEGFDWILKQFSIIQIKNSSNKRRRKL